MDPLPRGRMTWDRRRVASGAMDGSPQVEISDGTGGAPGAAALPGRRAGISLFLIKKQGGAGPPGANGPAAEGTNDVGGPGAARWTAEGGQVGYALNVAWDAS
jgi:hypothetical protein